MIFVYRSSGSDGAKELTEALGGMRVRGVQDGRFVRRFRPVLRTVRPHRGDVVVCWGEGLDNSLREGLRVLNGAPITGKFTDAQVLQRAGVATVEVCRTRPPNAEPTFFPLFQQASSAYNRAIDRDAARELIGRLQTYINTPEPVNQEWLPRRNNHVGGSDLLVAPTTPDYFSKKENLVEEYRVHIFKGKSIKAGVKVPRDGYQPHGWIRSLDGGWRIRYEGFKSKAGMRELAAGACEALGLDFGAVDLGKKADGRLIVLEVNRAPGLADGTVESYAAAINNWLEGGTQGEQS